MVVNRFEIGDGSIDPTDKFGGQVSSDTDFLFLDPESAKEGIRGLVSWMLSVTTESFFTSLLANHYQDGGYFTFYCAGRSQY